MSEVDPISVLSLEILRDQTGALIAETSAWCVGISDRPHFLRRHGRVKPSGYTLGTRAAAELPLGGEEDSLIGLGEARPGSFRDLLNALTPVGEIYADHLERDVLRPFSMRTCITAIEQARKTRPAVWADIMDDLGLEGDEDVDVEELVRSGQWAVALLLEAEQLVLAALGDIALIDVELEGAPLALLRSAEAITISAVPLPEHGAAERDDDDLAGALFLADAVLRAAALTVPVAPDDAVELLALLTDEGLQPDEIVRLLPDLPVQQETIELVLKVLHDDNLGGAG